MEEYLCALMRSNKMRFGQHYQDVLLDYLRMSEELGDSSELCALIANTYFLNSMSDPYETGEGHQEAVRWMKKAIALDPENGRLHANLAKMYYLGLLDCESSANEYREAIALQPNDAEIYIQAVGLLYRLPEEAITASEAVEWLETAVRLCPDEPSYYDELAYVYHNEGNIEKAKLAWTRALMCS